ncbi:MAG: ABC transporter substrate-binding protein [Chloroflexi bacterium]|nr:MAG: ABC transporter substrate-binding protein [Chloroflexota bacterium]TMC33705.1 MAG: ABC transporter substrate-binding protein [Chloroflexota bacterium]TMC58233.1 MAG: ABC transporter substrate-binding protein [Chloroflexota bacterium]
MAEERLEVKNGMDGARVFGSIGLTLALLLTACAAPTGGAGGGVATSSAAPAAASATAAPKATCQAKKVTIAVPVTPPNVVHLTPYVADAFGYFKDENLTVELVRFDGGVGSLRASASGAIDLAGTSAEPVLDAIANGADVKIVYTYAPNVDVSFAVSSSIKTMADLKGKKMGVQEAGGFADVMTRIVLKKAGIDPKDVTFVTTTTAGRVQALATGQTDTAVLHIDQVKTVQKQTPTISVLANMWELLSDYQYSVYIVPTQTLKDDPSTTECIVRALMRANRAMYDSANKQKVVDIAVKEGKIDATIAADTFDILVKAKAWPQNEGLLKANIEGTIKSEKDFGKITKDLKFEDVTDLTIAKKVVDQLGRVKDFPY